MNLSLGETRKILVNLASTFIKLLIKRQRFSWQELLLVCNPTKGMPDLKTIATPELTSRFTSKSTPTRDRKVCAALTALLTAHSLA